MVNCFILEVQQPKIDDRQKQFYNEVQSAGLELMVGMSVVCQKCIAAGSVFMIENIMLTV